MKIDQPDRQRCSIRLPDYDYCQPGAYFITICSYQREALFGNIAVDEMRLNEAGQIVWEVWNSLPARYAGITLDAAVVMPNHFHGIIIITDGAYGKMDEENTRRPSADPPPPPGTPRTARPFSYTKIHACADPLQASWLGFFRI